MLTNEEVLPISPARIAVVEDDEELRELMLSELAHRGFETHGFASAEALYRHLAVQRCDVVVLDVGLPGENGYAVATHLRQMANMGILMLTARGDASDMARGLSHGADLYLVKPLDIDVLCAAIDSLLRRLAPVAVPDEQGVPSASVMRWSLSAGGWNLRSPDGHDIPLGDAERAFLQPLLAQAGQPVQRDTIIAGMTTDPASFDPHRLEVLLHRLRTRVKSLTGHALPLRAVRGVGYLWLNAEG